jgi:hypothetical protein
MASLVAIGTLVEGIKNGSPGHCGPELCDAA